MDHALIHLSSLIDSIFYNLFAYIARPERGLRLASDYDLTSSYLCECLLPLLDKEVGVLVEFLFELLKFVLVVHMCGSVFGHPKRHIKLLPLVKLLVDAILHNGETSFGGFPDNIDLFPVQGIFICRELFLRQIRFSNSSLEFRQQFLSASRDYRFLLLIELLELVLGKRGR